MTTNFQITPEMGETWARMASGVTNTFPRSTVFNAERDRIYAETREEVSLTPREITKRFRSTRTYRAIQRDLAHELMLCSSHWHRLNNRLIQAQQKLVLAEERFFHTGIDDGSINFLQNQISEILEHGAEAEEKIRLFQGVNLLNCNARISLCTKSEDDGSYILTLQAVGAAAQP